jgi:hypothetical protein
VFHIFHRVPKGFLSLATFFTSQIRIGWRHHNAGMNTVTFHTPNTSRNQVLMFPLGEMMYVSAREQGVLLINSQRVAIDLLEKRSNIYSDRPRYISAGEFSTKNLMLTLTPYGDLYAINTPFYSFVLILQRWRRFRRVAVEGFSKAAVQHLHPIQGREAIILALALMKSPSTLEKHLQRHAWSIMLSVNHHFPPVDSEDDPVVANHVERLLHEMQPGTRLVEFSI